MPIPEFVLALRAKVGTDLLSLVGTTGVVRDEAGSSAARRTRPMAKKPRSAGSPSTNCRRCVLPPAAGSTGRWSMPAPPGSSA